MRNPCKSCIYYHPENNTCQSKKCATGGPGYVTVLDRLFCSPRKLQQNTRIFRGPGYTVKAHPQSCFFCQHLTDIFYDYTNGPYGFVCNLDGDIETGMKGECQDFKEIET